MYSSSQNAQISHLMGGEDGQLTLHSNTTLKVLKNLKTSKIQSLDISHTPLQIQGSSLDLNSFRGPSTEFGFGTSARVLLDGDEYETRLYGTTHIKSGDLIVDGAVLSETGIALENVLVDDMFILCAEGGRESSTYSRIDLDAQNANLRLTSMASNGENSFVLVSPTTITMQSPVNVDISTSEVNINHGVFFCNDSATFNNVATFNSRVECLSNSSIDGNLWVKARTSLSGEVFISSQTNIFASLYCEHNLNVDNSAVVGRDLTVNENFYTLGKSTFGDDVSFAKTVNISGATTMLSDLSLAGTLNASGNATFRSDISIGGRVTTNGVDSTGSITGTNFDAVTGTVTCRNLTSSIGVIKSLKIVADSAIQAGSNPLFSVVDSTQTVDLLKCDVNGILSGDGIWKRFEFDLTSQSSSSLFPLLVLDDRSSSSAHSLIYFALVSSIANAKSNTLEGFVEVGGYFLSSTGQYDMRPLYNMDYQFFDTTQRAFAGLYCGTTGFTNGFVIYVQGGQTYSLRTTAKSARVSLTSLSGSDVGTSIFPVKNYTTEADIGSSSLTYVRRLWNGKQANAGVHIGGDNNPSIQLTDNAASDTLIISQSGITQSSNFPNFTFSNGLSCFNDFNTTKYSSASAVASNALNFSRSRGTSNLPTIVSSGDSLATIRVSGYDGSQFVEGASLKWVANGTIGASRIPTSLVISTQSNTGGTGTTEKFRVDASGNIGINVSAPTAKLHLLQTGTEPSIRVDNVSNDATPFVVDANGNVGINTLTPTASLDVVGSGVFRKTSSSDTTDLINTLDSNGGVLFKVPVNGQLSGQGIWKTFNISLSSQSASTFYPLLLQDTVSSGTAYIIHFDIYGGSSASSTTNTINSLTGFVQGGGWNGWRPFFDINFQWYNNSLRNFGTLHTGSQTFANGMVVYVRGGCNYDIRTTANVVQASTTTLTVGSSIFPLKQYTSAMTDIGGTLTNAYTHWNGYTASAGKYIGGTNAPRLDVARVDTDIVNTTTANSIPIMTTTARNTVFAANTDISGIFVYDSTVDSFIHRLNDGSLKSYKPYDFSQSSDLTPPVTGTSAPFLVSWDCGFGVEPMRRCVIVKCISDDFGYVAGATVELPNYVDGDGTKTSILSANGPVLSFCGDPWPNFMYIVGPTNAAVHGNVPGDSSVPTISKWKIAFRAWRY